jgi:acyl carrier protein
MGEQGMTDDEIITVIDDIFEEYFEVEREKLRPEMNIFEDLELDSLDIVDLVVTMQKKFDVSIRDDERIRSVRTLGDVHQFVLTLKREGVTPAAQ